MLSPRACCLVLLLVATPALAQREHGFDNRKPSGQDYWSPEKSVQGMKVPPGYEVTVFAAEPDVVNPVAFTIDEKGRVWVVECFEYPKRTPKGKQPRDRIHLAVGQDHAGDRAAPQGRTLRVQRGRGVDLAADVGGRVDQEPVRPVTTHRDRGLGGL